MTLVQQANKITAFIVKTFLKHEKFVVDEDRQ